MYSRITITTTLGVLRAYEGWEETKVTVGLPDDEAVAINGSFVARSCSNPEKMYFWDPTVAWGSFIRKRLNFDPDTEREKAYREDLRVLRVFQESISHTLPADIDQEFIVPGHEHGPPKGCAHCGGTYFICHTLIRAFVLREREQSCGYCGGHIDCWSRPAAERRHPK